MNEFEEKVVNNHVHIKSHTLRAILLILNQTCEHIVETFKTN